MSQKLKPMRYEIRVRGLLSETLLAAFPDLDARGDRGETVLAGELPDQAALYGVLAQIEALSLELLEVRRLPRGRETRLGEDGDEHPDPDAGR